MLAPSQKTHTPAEKLAFFRMLCGALFFVAALRYFLYGWAERFYIEPATLFTLYPLQWLPRPPAAGIYALFVGQMLAAVGIFAGYRYRIACLVWLFCFAYVECLDFTHYLNHHYLFFLLGLLLLFTPAHVCFSADAAAGRCPTYSHIDAKYLHLIYFQIICVYFFAALAKMQPDWLVQHQPLRTWLARHSGLPLVGSLLAQPTTAALMSWGGMLYDLCVGFLLLLPRTRLLAYAAVVGFHLLTYFLFNIGIFPLAMIALALVFFDIGKKRILTLSKLKLFSTFAPQTPIESRAVDMPTYAKLTAIIYIILQIALPLRSHILGKSVLWDEVGFRFSWRVMLIEKWGEVQFSIRDTCSGAQSWAESGEDLTEKQIYMMQTQADFIHHHAHYLAEKYQRLHGYQCVEVRAFARCALNGRRSQWFIDSSANLYALPLGSPLLPIIVPLQ